MNKKFSNRLSDQLSKEIITYNHPEGRRYEYLRKQWVNIGDMSSSPECIDSTHTLGYACFKILQIVPELVNLYYCDRLSTETSATLSKSIKKKYFSFDTDRLLFDNFISNQINTLCGWMHDWMVLVQNILSFVELCSRDSKFCNKKNLAMISSRNVRPLEGSKVLIDCGGLFGDALSPEDVSLFLETNCAQEKAVICFNSYEIVDLSSICLGSLQEIFNDGHIIKKCPNCGRYFVPFSRSDTVFCDEKAPQDTSRTCKEYGNYMSYLRKTQLDEATKLYKQIYNAKVNRVKRGYNPRLKAELDQFILDARQWKSKVKAGTKTEAEYIEWLKAVKGKKVL